MSGEGIESADPPAGTVSRLFGLSDGIRPQQAHFTFRTRGLTRPGGLYAASGNFIYPTGCLALACTPEFMAPGDAVRRLIDATDRLLGLS